MGQTQSEGLSALQKGVGSIKSTDEVFLVVEDSKIGLQLFCLDTDYLEAKLLHSISWIDIAET